MGYHFVLCGLHVTIVLFFDSRWMFNTVGGLLLTVCCDPCALLRCLALMTVC